MSLWRCRYCGQDPDIEAGCGCDDTDRVAAELYDDSLVLDYGQVLTPEEKLIACEQYTEEYGRYGSKDWWRMQVHAAGGERRSSNLPPWGPWAWWSTLSPSLGQH